MPKNDHDHDHEHDHEEEMEETELITVIDDEGREHDFELFTILVVGSAQYAVLYPIEDEESSEEEAEAVILRLEKDENGEDILLDIEDEVEWNGVVAAWEAFVAEQDEEV